MTSDFGSDIFGETPKSSPSPSTPPPAKAEGAAVSTPQGSTSDSKTNPDAPTPPDQAAGEAGPQEGSDGGPRKTRKKRTRSRRKTPARDSKPDGEADQSKPVEARSSDEATDASPIKDGGDSDANDHDGENRGRRRGRRPRSGQGRDREEGGNRHDRGNHGHDREERGNRRDRGNHGHDREDRGNRRNPRREDNRPNRPALDLPPRQRVAIFMDAAELKARADGREISFGHLRRHVTNARIPIRAIAYHPAKDKDLAKSLQHCGFEVTAVDSKSATNITIAIDAMALADRVDCVILVPGTNSLAHLAKTLRARGVRVESASFDEAGEAKLGANEHRSVGSESCFVV